jgi:hypothetical protein
VVLQPAENIDGVAGVAVKNEIASRRDLIADS